MFSLIRFLCKKRRHCIPQKLATRYLISFPHGIVSYRMLVSLISGLLYDGWKEEEPLIQRQLLAGIDFFDSLHKLPQDHFGKNGCLLFIFF